MARAESHWDEKQDAVSDKQRYHNQLQSIRDQLACLSPANEHSRELLLDDQEYKSELLESADRREEQAEERLDEISSEWERIREEETEQDEQTATHLRSIDLGPLVDPGFWERISDCLISNVGWLFDLKTLRSLLQGLLVVLFLVMLIAGPGWLILGAMAAVAVTKLAIGIALYNNGELSGGQLAWDIADVAFSLFGLGGYGAGLLGQAGGIRLTLQSQHTLIVNSRVLRQIIVVRRGGQVVGAAFRTLHTSLKFTWTTTRSFSLASSTLLGASRAVDTAGKVYSTISGAVTMAEFDRKYGLSALPGHPTYSPSHSEMFSLSGVFEQLRRPVPMNVSSGRPILVPSGLGM